MAEDLSAVMEAPAVETPALETPEAVTPAEPVEAPVAEPVGEEVKGDERTLPRWIRDLKDTRPQDFRAAKDAFFTQKQREEALKDFDLDGAKSLFEEHGGREQLVQTLQEREAKAQEWEQVQQDFAAGNPALIEKLFAESPDGGVKIAPAVMGAWAKADPEGYAQTIYGTVASVLANSGINQILTEVGYMVKYQDADGLANSLKALQEKLGSFSQMAQAPRTHPVPQSGQKADSTAQAAEQQKLLAFQDRTELRAAPARMAEISKELGMKDVPPRLATAIKNEIDARLAKDASFMSSFGKFVKNGDVEGAAKLLTSREKDLVAKVALDTAKEYGIERPKAAAAPAPKPAPTPRVSAPVAAQATDPKAAIFARIAQR